MTGGRHLGGGLRVWDVATGKAAHPPIDHREVVDHLAVLADDRAVVVARSNRPVIHDYDLKPDAPRREIPATDWSFLTAIRALPDRTLLVVGGHARSGTATPQRGLIRVVDPPTGRSLRTFDDDGEELEHAVLTADGSAVYGSGYRGRLHVWDAGTGKAAFARPALGTVLAVSIAGNRGRRSRVWLRHRHPGGRRTASPLGSP